MYRYEVCAAYRKCLRCSGEKSMYSFDIFDTLIARTTATPKGIFALMKDRLEKERGVHDLDVFVVDNFFELRIHSEELARKSKEMQWIEEVTLQDIYDAMSLCGCISHEQKKYLMDLEIKTEIENVIGIEENILRLKELLEKGENVVLISDMYLSADVIRKMLLKIDKIFADIPVYVSSEYLMRKTTGKIYTKVQELENVKYEEWTHIGDNKHQDVEIPYKLGIHTEYYEKKNGTAFEWDLLEKYESDSSLQLLIGAAMRSRNGKDDSNAYQTGCCYGGPVLYSYAEWIVEQACKKKIERLYFIARDGYLIKKIVDKILSERGLAISTKYIYGSRKAWRMPSLSKDHYNLYQLILWSHSNRIKTLQNLANVLEISLKELYTFLPGTYAKNQNQIEITNQELEYIADSLTHNEAFKEWHLESLKEKRKLVQEYLRQEVDTSDGNFAFVDVSGGGLTQGCLKELLKEQHDAPIRTFFFKIDRVNLIKDSITDTFIPSFLENNLVVEMMCRAPHGQTNGYAWQEGTILPKMSCLENQQLLEHGFGDYEKGILDFSETACRVTQKDNRKIGTVKNVLLYVKHIAQEPSQDVLDFFAAMPSSESGRDGEVIEYAPRLKKQELKDIFLGHTNEPLEDFYKGTNLNYSLLRASEEERKLVEQYRKDKYSAIGVGYRWSKNLYAEELRKKYGKAAFYPVRLLPERIILYGAGKFGQDLYHRLKTDQEHTIALWVDKYALKCRENGLDDVKEITEIDLVSELPIVIAVMKQEIAEEISSELVKRGIAKERIIWLPVYNNRYCQDSWKVNGIG